MLTEFFYIFYFQKWHIFLMRTINTYFSLSYFLILTRIIYNKYKDKYKVEETQICHKSKNSNNPSFFKHTHSHTRPLITLNTPFNCPINYKSVQLAVPSKLIRDDCATNCSMFYLLNYCKRSGLVSIASWIIEVAINLYRPHWRDNKYMASWCVV